MNERPLPEQVIDCALYPLRSEGAFVILAGAFAFPALGSCLKASLAWMTGLYTFLVGLGGVVFCTAGLVAAGAYLLVYAEEVLRSSARGANVPPGWPRINAVAFLEFLFFALVCLPVLLPGAAIALAGEESPVFLGLLPYWIAVYCWFPLAFYIFAKSKQVLKAVNPAVVLRVARRNLLAYGRVLLVLGAVSLALALLLWAAWVAFFIVLLPVLPFSGQLHRGLISGAMSIIASGAAVYWSMVLARLMGRFSA